MNKRELDWRQVEKELGFAVEEYIDWGEFGLPDIIIPDKIPDLFVKMSKIDEKTKAKYISNDTKQGITICLRTFFISYVTDIPAAYCEFELPEVVATLRVLNQVCASTFKDTVLDKIKNFQADIKQMLVDEKILQPLELNFQLPPTLFLVLKECTRPEGFLDEIYTLRQSRTIRDFRKWCADVDKARKTGDIESLARAVQELTLTARKLEKEFSVDPSETKILKLIPDIAMDLTIAPTFRSLYKLMELPLSKLHWMLKKRHLIYTQRLGRSISAKKSIKKELSRFNQGLKGYKTFRRMVSIISQLEKG